MVRRKYLLILLMAVPAWVYAQSAQEIIANYFDTVSHGDIRNWSQIKSAYIESRSVYSAAEYEGKPDFTLSKPTTHKLYRVWPDQSREDLYQDSSLVSSFFHLRKEQFFVMGNMEPMPMSSGPYEPYFEFDPVRIRNLMDKAKSIELVGTVDMQGINCFEVRLHLKELVWRFYFNAHTFLLEFWSNSPDGAGETLTKVYDYKRVENFLIPMSEVKSRNGVIFFSATRSRVDLNVDIDPGRFVHRGR